MLVYVQGVLVDGSSPTTNVPTGQPISLPQGMDAVVQMTLTRSSGTVVDVSTYTGFKLVIKTASVGGIQIASIAGTATDPTHGIVQFTIPAATSRQLLGTYVYDIVSTNASALKDEVVPDSFMELFQAVGA